MDGLTRRTMLRTAAGVTSAAVLTAAGTGVASEAEAVQGGDAGLYLLRPTGPHPVGAVHLYLKDSARPDPWVPEAGARELMVTFWYPARARHGRLLPYMSAEESRLFLEGKRFTDLPPAILSTVRTHARAGAAPAGRRGGLPLVVLSPGYTQPRNSLSGLAEDLASHGYAVVAIDHTYETYAVTFPDGRIATCATCAYDDRPGFFDRVHSSRAKDVAFVLDRLTGPHPAWRGSRLIDTDRIGMSGHSAGGASALPVLRHDPRVSVGVDMDGSTSAAVPDSGLDRPFVFLGAEFHHRPGGPDSSWDHDWQRLTGWRRWIVVDGTRHASFNDISLFGDQLGIDYGATTSGARSMEITRRYHRAVFDLHLRGRRQPLLERASGAWPEVEIVGR